MNNLKVPGLLAILFVVSTVPVFGTSARAIHPELVGIKQVFLNVSLQNLPDIDDQALEKEIRGYLADAGIAVDRSARISLFVHLSYQPLPACPDFVAFRTELAVSEDVPVRRGSRTESVYVDTWHTSEEFVEPKTKAGSIAYDSLVGLVKYLLDSQKYSESVIAKKK